MNIKSHFLVVISFKVNNTSLLHTDFACPSSLSTTNIKEIYYGDMKQQLQMIDKSIPCLSSVMRI